MNPPPRLIRGPILFIVSFILTAAASFAALLMAYGAHLL